MGIARSSLLSRCRAITVAVVVALSLLITGATSDADPQPAPLEFRPDAISVKSTDLQASTPRAELYNNTGRAQTVSLLVTKLKDKAGKELCPAADCVTATLIGRSGLEGAPLEAGSSATLKLVVSPKDPAQGTYTASVSAYVAETDVAARASLTVTIGTTGTVAAMPLVPSAKADIHCKVARGHHCSSGTDLWLPLKPDVKSESADVSLTLLDLTVGGTVGAVVGDHGSGVVKLEEIRGAPDGTYEVRVRISGLSHPGDYEGTIDLVPPATDDIGDVTIKATVSDAIGWPIAMLIAGILVALGLIYLAGSGRAIVDFRIRRGQALSNIADASMEFVRAAKGAPWAAYNISLNANERGVALSGLIDELSYTSFGAVDDAKSGPINERIDSLSAAAGNLREFQVALPALDVASKTLDSRESVLPTLSPALVPPPAIRSAAAKLTTGRALTLDELAAALKDAKAMTELIADWKASERHVSECQILLEQISAQAAVGDQAELTTVRRLLRSAWQDLWGVESEDELERVDSAIATVHSKLGALRSVETVQPMPQRAASVASGRTDHVSVVFSGDPTANSPKDEVMRLIRNARLVELAVLVLGFALALITGLQALYVGEAWGTWLDYMSAFFWGIGTQTALTLLLVPSLNQLARLRTSRSLMGLVR